MANVSLSKDNALATRLMVSRSKSKQKYHSFADGFESFTLTKYIVVNDCGGFPIDRFRCADVQYDLW